MQNRNGCMQIRHRCDSFYCFLCCRFVLDEAIKRNKPEIFVCVFKAVLKLMDNTVKRGQTDFKKGEFFLGRT